MTYENGSVIVGGHHRIAEVVDGCLFINAVILFDSGAVVRNCVFDSCAVQSHWGVENISIINCQIKEPHHDT